MNLFPQCKWDSTPLKACQKEHMQLYCFILIPKRETNTQRP